MAEADDDLPGRDPRANVGFGPRKAPIAPVMQECMSDPVPAMTRAVKVDALNSCSA